MSKLTFIYNENKYEISIGKKSLNSLNESVFQEYSKNITKNINTLLFMYKGKKVSSTNCHQIIKKFIINKNNIIFVYNLNIYNEINDISNDFICPDCKHLTFLNFNDNNINNCKNKHINVSSCEYSSVTDFMKGQFINEKQIKCGICNNNKYLYEDNFYVCYCKEYICPLCADKHRKMNNHNILHFKNRYENCNKHLFKYLSYCSLCNLNLCERCEEEHKNHKSKIIIYKKELPNEKKINEIKKEIDLIVLNLVQFKKEINKIIDLFKFFVINFNEDIDNYIKLYDKMLNSLDNLNNYQAIKNILNYKEPNLNKDISIFLNENTKNRIKYIISKLKEDITEISLTYNINYLF